MPKANTNQAYRSGKSNRSSGNSNSYYPSYDPKEEGYDDDQAKEISDHEKGAKQFHDEIAEELAKD